MSRYRILESVGLRVERVHDYADLEIHHPSKRGHEPGRTYATVNGQLEEILKNRSPGGERMVSKDFILQDEHGSPRVPVPSPVAGYVGRVDAANGLVAIYDRKGGELLVQVRHMDLRASQLKVGDSVEYGDPLGIQSGFGKGSPRKYGVHVHMDVNEACLDRFDRFLRDMDRGALTPAGVGSAVPTAAASRKPSAGANTAPRDPGEQPTGAPRSRGHARQAASAAIRRDPHVEQSQRALAHLGYTGLDGLLIEADGRIGRHTRYAVEQYQRDHRLPVTGHLDDTTRARLAADERTTVSRMHPAHVLYRQSLDAVHALDRQLGIPSGPHSLALAGVAAAEAARAGLTRIDRIELGKDGIRAQAVQFNLGVDFWATNRTSAAINVSRAVAQPIEVSSQQAEQAIAAQRAEGARTPQSERHQSRAI